MIFCSYRDLQVNNSPLWRGWIRCRIIVPGWNEWSCTSHTHCLPVSSAEGFFSHHPLGSHTSRTAELPCSPGGWVCERFPPAHAHLEEIPLSSGLGFPSIRKWDPVGIRIWWLQGEGWHGRDWAAGSSFAVLGQQRSECQHWPEGWQEHGARHRMSSTREKHHPTGQWCGSNMMVKQLPDGKRQACLEVISEESEVLLFLAYLQL